ncbi:hypothetical protein PSYMO_38258, partial [Pseudomonas amygdali pv. mori str. 301020]
HGGFVPYGATFLIFMEYARQLRDESGGTAWLWAK